VSFARITSHFPLKRSSMIPLLSGDCEDGSGLDPKNTSLKAQLLGRIVVRPQQTPDYVKTSSCSLYRLRCVVRGLVVIQLGSSKDKSASSRSNAADPKCGGAAPAAARQRFLIAGGGLRYGSYRSSGVKIVDSFSRFFAPGRRHLLSDAVLALDAVMVSSLLPCSTDPILPDRRKPA